MFIVPMVEFIKREETTIPKKNENIEEIVNIICDGVIELIDNKNNKLSIVDIYNACKAECEKSYVELKEFSQYLKKKHRENWNPDLRFGKSKPRGGFIKMRLKVNIPPNNNDRLIKENAVLKIENEQLKKQIEFLNECEKPEPIEINIKLKNKTKRKVNINIEIENDEEEEIKKLERALEELLKK
jgi:hypothetical protein